MRIFEKLSSYAVVAPLYMEEQLYDRLLKFVLAVDDIYLLRQYEAYLKPLYPEELLTKYEDAVNNMAFQASDRKRYKEVAAILKGLKTYSGGKERIEKIVSDWRFRYKNRRAMIDELSKL